MAENPQNIIRSWNLQTSFATGPVVTDKLVPPPYGRIRTNFVQTWRTQALSNVDWGVQNFSIYLPESLRVVSAIYLKLEVPANGSASYKAYPGLYAIRSMRLLSGGQEDARHTSHFSHSIVQIIVLSNYLQYDTADTSREVSEKCVS